MANRRRESPCELTESWPDVPSSDPADETARLFVRKPRSHANIHVAMNDLSDVSPGRASL